MTAHQPHLSHISIGERKSVHNAGDT